MSKLTILSAPAPLKGCLSAKEVSSAIYSGVCQAVDLFNHQSSKDFSFNFVSKPVADGGDDSLESLASSTQSETVHGHVEILFKQNGAGMIILQSLKWHKLLVLS
jgi:glycerate kinase